MTTPRFTDADLIRMRDRNKARAPTEQSSDLAAASAVAIIEELLERRANDAKSVQNNQEETT